MIPAIKASLDKIVGNVTTLSRASGAGRAYELFVMTGLANELHSRGWNVQLQRSDETIIGAFDADRTFYQRGGAPTGVPGKRQGKTNGGSIVINKPRGTRFWEIWNGIQFRGRSGGYHEVDVAIVPREVGLELRKKPGGGIPGGRPRVSIECKDVGSAGSPDEMRAFLARMYDLTILTWHVGKISHWPSPERNIYPGTLTRHGPFASFWSGNRQTFNAIVRRTGFSLGALGLTPYYRVGPYGSVTASATPGYSTFIRDVTDFIGQRC